jgi:hypothetical protein
MVILKSEIIWRAEQSQRYKEWQDKIPHIPFRHYYWDVRAIPPFGGAILRYRVKHNGKEVSIYLDAYDELGSVGQPYWEIYPCADGGTWRCLLNEVGDLVAEIAKALGDA